MSEATANLMNEAHETMKLLTEHTERMVSAEADANRLAEALEAMLRCPAMGTVAAARKALDNHKALNAEH